jgi:hypothetical protein
MLSLSRNNFQAAASERAELLQGAEEKFSSVLETIFVFFFFFSRERISRTNEEES